MSPSKKKVRESAALTPNARLVLEKRYLKKDPDGNVIETPEDMFKRVAQAVAVADLKFDPKTDASKTARGFEEILMHLYFLPNSPTLMKIGRASCRERV